MRTNRHGFAALAVAALARRLGGDAYARRHAFIGYAAYTTTASSAT